MDTWGFDHPDGRSETWAREANGDRFRLVAYGGLGPADSSYGNAELAALVGARIEQEGRAAVLYPGRFRYSPTSGQALADPAGIVSEGWLPPYGLGHNPDPKYLPGLRQTDVDLRLPRDFKPEQDPPVALPLPPPGDYHFLVGRLSTCRPCLLAIEPRKGMLYVWRDSPAQWSELRGVQTLLPETSLPLNQWGLACTDPQGRRLFLPTDRGLAQIDIDILRLTYDLHLFPGQCKGAPVCYHCARLFVPVRAENGTGSVLLVDAVDPIRTTLLEVSDEFLSAPFIPALVDRRQVIWLSQAGQLSLKLDDANRLPRVAALAWPAGFTPGFQFGSPYRARDGGLWQIGFDQRAGRYAYSSLGSDQPEKQETTCPRFGSGTVTFRLDVQLRGNPWLDPEMAADAGSGYIVVPLLESPNTSALCVRIPWSKSAEELLSSQSKHHALFRLVMDDGDSSFYRHKLARPWLARPFVYRDHIYLYHQDFDRSIPGWKILHR